MTYSTGTVQVANGSATVTGTGTAWLGILQQGWRFVGPDGRSVGIADVVSNTELTLTMPYLGGNASGQAYEVYPTASLAVDLVTQMQAILSGFQGVIDTIGESKIPVGDDLVFEEDPDTGLKRAAANALALFAGGATKFQVSGNEATGDVVQSGSQDATAGRLLKVGAFGLGAAVATLDSGDLNDIPTSGLYRYDAGNLNKPGASSNGMVLHMRRTATIHAQLAISRSTSTLGRVYSRATAGNGWSDWAELLFEGNTAHYAKITTTANAVGAFAFACNKSTAAIPGDGTIAGADLKSARVMLSDGSLVLESGNRSGTWKALGYTPVDAASLFVRIA